MRTLGRGRARAVRGLSLALACLVVPAVAHVAAGGAVPLHGGFVLVAALIALGCVAWADRRRSVAEIAAVLLLTQPAQHILLTLGGHAEPAADGWAMVAAHIVAAGVLTIVLSGAESVAWAMAALSSTILLGRARRLPTATSAPGAPPRSFLVPESTTSSPVSRVVRAAPRRGPPIVAGI